jgi:hypothetical protein
MASVFSYKVKAPSLGGKNVSIFFVNSTLRSSEMSFVGISNSFGISIGFLININFKE